MKKIANPWFLLYLFIPVLALNLFTIGENHNLYLSYSLLNGHLDLIEKPKITNDLSFFQGKYYWPLGPMPAIILSPFTLLFGLNFNENLIKLPVTIINFWLIYKIAEKLKLHKSKSLLLATFFIFGSIYTPLSVIPVSVYLSQQVGTLFVLSSILEFLNKKRWFIIGIMIGLASLSRTTLILSFFFYFCYLILENKNSFKNIIMLTFPICLIVTTMAIYNYQRFNSFTEFGFSYRLIPQETRKIKNQGLFSIKNVPTNLYHLLIGTPKPVTNKDFYRLRPPFLKPDYWGMSIFLISPILLLLFKANYKEKINIIALATTFIMLIPITTYYGIGWRQIGYRYALDFLPFLIFPLSLVIKRTPTHKIALLVLIGVIITWFFTIEMLLNF